MVLTINPFFAMAAPAPTTCIVKVTCGDMTAEFDRVKRDDKLVCAEEESDQVECAKVCKHQKLPLKKCKVQRQPK